MFSNLGMGEVLALVVLALVILGPERLPGAITWFFSSLRQVRDYATGATQQLKNDMGSDFDSIREPLQQIQNLRGMTPTAIVTKHLLNGDDTLLRDMKNQARSTADSLNIKRIINESGSASVPPTGAASSVAVPPPVTPPPVTPANTTSTVPRFDPDAT